MSGRAALRVAVAQLPNRVGDITGNAQRIAEAMDWAEQEEAAILVVPELALTGYGLRDLILHRGFVDEAAEALDELARQSEQTTTVVGTIDRVPPTRSWDTRPRTVAISAAMLSGGEIRGTYHKVLLPAYDLFDEARLFAPGSNPDQIWRIGDVVAGVAICEDLWSPDGPPEAQSAAGARVLIAPNASPFHRGKVEGRLSNTRAVAMRNGIPVVYVNCVGGQDELAFDGGSIVVGSDGSLLHRGLEFETDRFWIDLPLPASRTVAGSIATVHTRPVLREAAAPDTPSPAPRPPLDDVAAVWQAIVVAMRDYVQRNGFRGVALGLSDGLDAAVTAALAVDAVGADRVLALTMPAPDTTPDQTAAALAVAERLGIALEVLSIDLPNTDEDVPDAAKSPNDHDAASRQRSYARVRAAVLGDIFEERRYLVLTTGNKSEISIGEASLYGELAGGFAPLKDCPKTLVYALARFRSRQDAFVPPELMSPTSEGVPSIPTGSPLTYEILDEIVQRYVELGEDLSDMVSAGFDPGLVESVLGRIDDAELIRRYAPPGVKVTSRAFDQDRRMPISNEWRPHHRPDRDTGAQP